MGEKNPAEKATDGPRLPTPAPKKRGRKPGSRGHRNNKEIRVALQREHDAREAYRLYYIEKKTLQEVADKLGRKSLGNVHSIIAEEKRRLRGAFTEDALDHWNFAFLELRSLYGRAMDSYILEGEPKQGRLAAFVLDKIIKMTVGYLPSEHRLSGSLNVKHEHAGAIGIVDLAQLRAQILNDPDYLEFLRSRALTNDAAGGGDVVDVATTKATQPVAVAIDR